MATLTNKESKGYLNDKIYNFSYKIKPDRAWFLELSTIFHD